MKNWSVALIGLFLANSIPCNAQNTDEGSDSLSSHESHNAKWQTVRIGKYFYQFPVVDDLVRYFGPSPSHRVEIVVSDSFWCSILAHVDPENWPEPLCTTNPGSKTLGFSKPDELFQWRTSGNPEQPPVRGPLELWRVSGNVKLWRSLDPEIHIDGLLYATFQGRTDIYGQCNANHLDWLHACDINWFDGTMIHHLSVPAKWLPNAPAAVDEYRRRIKQYQK